MIQGKEIDTILNWSVFVYVCVWIFLWMGGSSQLNGFHMLTS